MTRSRDEINKKPHWHFVCGLRFVAAFSVASLATDQVMALTYAPGDVFWGDNDSDLREFHNITGGGDFSSVSPFAVLPGRTPGQVAWSQDLTTAYVTMFDLDSVVAVSASGSVSTFATGIDGPTGLIATSSGRLLAAEWWTGAILDITSGIPVPFATGLSGPRNMYELSTGEILLSEQPSGEVTDISGGGDLSGVTPFAYGLGENADIVQDSSGRIFVSQFSSQQVMDITTGGDFSAATPFATGRSFMGLAVDGSGRLLASELFYPNVLDISAGGDFSAAAGYAFNLNFGESALDTVPTPIPEPATSGLITVCLLSMMFLTTLERRRC